MEIEMRNVFAEALNALCGDDCGDIPEMTDAADAAPDGFSGKLEFDLQRHDATYHGGHYDGGACKYRDKMAKMLGDSGLASGVINNLNRSISGGGDGGGGKAERKEPGEALNKWLKFKASYEADPDGCGGKAEYNRQLDAFLVSELGDAEYDCYKRLRSIASEDGEAGDKAEAKAHTILGDEAASEAQKEAARKIIEDRDAWRIGEKTYRNIDKVQREQGFWAAMKAAFKAGLKGEDIITSWDKKSGRWDAIKANAAKFDSATDALKDAVAENKTEDFSGKVCAKLDKLMERDDLSENQRITIGGYRAMVANPTSSLSQKMKVWNEIQAYLTEQGLDRNDAKPVNKDYLEDGDNNHRAGGVTGSDGSATWAPDTSYADRADSKGSLSDMNEVVSRIQKAFSATNIPLDAKDIKVTPFTASTSISVPLGDRPLSKKEQNALMANLRYKMPHLNDKETKISINEETGTVDLSFANDSKGNVSFGGVLDSPEWKKRRNDGTGAFALGRDENGDAVVSSLDEAVHIVIAGQTGAGKSARLHNLVCSLVDANSPDDLRLIMIDPKSVELSQYKGLPHLIGDVVTDMGEAEQKFAWAVNESENRYKLFEKAGVSNIGEYNDLAKAGLLPDGFPKHLPRVALVSEELADLMDTHGPEVEGHIKRLAQKARAAGVHLVLATQRPDAKTMPHTITTNIPTKIGMATDNETDARVIGIKGLTKLPMRGPFAYKLSGHDTVWGEGSYLDKNAVKEAVNSAKDAWEKRKSAPQTTPPPPKSEPPATPPPPPAATNPTPTTNPQAGTVVTTLSQNQVAAAQKKAAAVSAGVKKFQNLHKPVNAAQQVAQNALIESEEGWADE